ncbi:MAG: DinB family protein [Bacteroidota bacterium]
MRTTTKARLDSLDQQLDNWVSELEKYTHEQHNQAGENRGWSAMQCMHHLLLSEKYSLQYLRKKISYDPKVDKVGFSAYWRMGVLRIYLGLPLKFKAPAMIATDKLPETSDLQETAQAYREHRLDLRRYLSDLDPKWYDRAVYKHPFAGRLGINQMLGFFKWHFVRHQKQGDRAIRRVAP